MDLNFSGANLFAGLLFGAIGFVAFVYGKKQMELKPLILGIMLLVFPYFISNTTVLYVVGAVLTILLFVPI